MKLIIMLLILSKVILGEVETQEEKNQSVEDLKKQIAEMKKAQEFTNLEHLDSNRDKGINPELVNDVDKLSAFFVEDEVIQESPVTTNKVAEVSKPKEIEILYKPYSIDTTQYIPANKNEYVEELTKEISPKIYNNQVSVRFSNLTGYGASYQRTLFRDWAVRATGWVQFNNFKEYDEDVVYELRENMIITGGLDLQRNFFRERNYRVFAFAGGGYAVEKSTESILNEETMEMNISENNLDNKKITGGAGFGFEYFISFFSIDTGLSYKWEREIDSDVYNTDSDTFRDQQVDQTGLGINIGANVLF